MTDKPKNKRGRKAPKHDPILCGGCGRAPRVHGERVLQCECSPDAKWHIELIPRENLPEWAKHVEWPE